MGNLDLHQKVRASNSIKTTNEENLNTVFLRNCMKSKRPKAPVAKQSFVRVRVEQLSPILIENQIFNYFIAIDEIFQYSNSISKKNFKNFANSVHGVHSGDKCPQDTGSVCLRYPLWGVHGMNEDVSILIRN